jgi:integrase/recombinase XerD
MNPIVQDFSRHLSRLGYSKGSQAMLPACVAEFLAYTDKQLYGIGSADITRYHAYLQQRPNKRRCGGLSEQMIHHHLYALRVLFMYLEQTQRVRINPMSGLVFPSPQQRQRVILDREEVQALFTATHTLREKAVLHLCYSCGLRRNEAVQLNAADIHFKGQLLYVRSGKGAKRRVIPLPERVATDLQHYMQYERAEQLRMARPAAAFILSRRGTRLLGDSLNNGLKALVERAGIEKSVSLHDLRHSIATHLLTSGLPLEQVRDFLGHAHLESTQLYTHVDSVSLKQTMAWNYPIT